MAPYRVRRVAAVTMQAAVWGYVPPILLSVVVMLARVLTPQMSQAMTSPVSTVSLAAETIFPNSP